MHDPIVRKFADWLDRRLFNAQAVPLPRCTRRPRPGPTAWLRPSQRHLARMRTLEARQRYAASLLDWLRAG